MSRIGNGTASQAGPVVRIRFPPAASLRTFGPSAEDAGFSSRLECHSPDSKIDRPGIGIDPVRPVGTGANGSELARRAAPHDKRDGLVGYGLDCSQSLGSAAMRSTAYSSFIRMSSQPDRAASGAAMESP